MAEIDWDRAAKLEQAAVDRGDLPGPKMWSDLGAISCPSCRGDGCSECRFQGMIVPGDKREHQLQALWRAQCEQVGHSPIGELPRSRHDLRKLYGAMLDALEAVDERFEREGWTNV